MSEYGRQMALMQNELTSRIKHIHTKSQLAEKQANPMDSHYLQ